MVISYWICSYKQGKYNPLFEFGNYNDAREALYKIKNKNIKYTILPLVDDSCYL